MYRAIKLALLMCATAVLAVASSQVNVPDWVKQAAAQPSGSYPPRTNAVVLLDDGNYLFTSANEFQEHYREVVRILRPEGRSEGEFLVRYRAGEKVTAIHAWSIDASGHAYELKDKEFIVVSPFGTDELYSDYMAIGGKVAGADVGSVIALEYTVIRHPDIPQIEWNFQQRNPVVKSSLTLALPAGWEYKTFWAGGHSFEPMPLGGSNWQWIRENLPGIEREEMSPAYSSLLSRMTVSVFVPGAPAVDSWKSIGDWNNGLTKDRRVPTPEIAAKAHELTAGVSGFDATVRALAHFMQRDIRYVAVEVGIGGQQPHFAADIFRHRYGDCKDKSTLLAAMLQSVGINSYYFSVNTNRGIVTEGMPNLEFDHEILAIELPAGAPDYHSVVTSKSGQKFLIFDPTDEFTPLGELGAELQGGYGLLNGSSGGELIRLPILDPDTNRREKTAKFVLTADGGLSGEVLEKRNGDSAWAWRAAMMQLNDLERTRYIERYFAYSLKGLSIKESKLDNINQLAQDLISHYKISVDNYAQTTGPLLLIRPRVIGSFFAHIDYKDRKYDVDLDSPLHATDSYEIQLPEGYVVDDMPNPVKVDVGFATYQSRCEATGSTVKYWREYILKDPVVPQAKLGDLHRLEDAIGGDEYSTIVLKKK